jgi:hypothetical protein
MAASKGVDLCVLAPGGGAVIVGPAGVPCRVPGYTVEPVDSELLLYHGERATVVYLNQTAFLIWQLCDSARSIADISTLFADAFPEKPDAIAHDVAATVNLLVVHGVLAFA